MVSFLSGRSEMVRMMGRHGGGHPGRPRRHGGDLLVPLWLAPHWCLPGAPHPRWTAAREHSRTGLARCGRGECSGSEQRNLVVVRPAAGAGWIASGLITASLCLGEALCSALMHFMEREVADLEVNHPHNNMALWSHCPVLLHWPMLSPVSCMSSCTLWLL